MSRSVGSIPGHKTEPLTNCTFTACHINYDDHPATLPRKTFLLCFVVALRAVAFLFVSVRGVLKSSPSGWELTGIGTARTLLGMLGL